VGGVEGKGKGSLEGGGTEVRAFYLGLASG
jgi:hypothetical protein